MVKKLKDLQEVNLVSAKGTRGKKVRLLETSALTQGSLEQQKKGFPGPHWRGVRSHLSLQLCLGCCCCTGSTGACWQASAR